MNKIPKGDKWYQKNMVKSNLKLGLKQAWEGDRLETPREIRELTGGINHAENRRGGKIGFDCLSCIVWRPAGNLWTEGGRLYELQSG